MQLGPIVTIPKAGQSTCKPLRTILTIGGSHYLVCCYHLIFFSSVLSIYCIFCLWRWCSKSCNLLCKDFHSVMSGVSASGLLAFETVCRILSSSSCLVVPRAFWWTTFSSWSSFLLWGCATDAKSEPWEFGRATKYMTHTLWLRTGSSHSLLCGLMTKPWNPIPYIKNNIYIYIKTLPCDCNFQRQHVKSSSIAT